MAEPTLDQFRELEEQVARLTRLAASQAAYMRDLMAFAGPATDEVDAKLYTISEAMDLIGVKRTAFGEARRALGVEPARRKGKSPLFTRQQVDRIGEHIYGE